MDENLNKEQLEMIRLFEGLGLKDMAGYKNLIAIKDYTTATRDMLRETQQQVKMYTNQVVEQGKVIEQLRSQIQQLQIKIYTNKPTA
tara:strand:- start:651 stop:911 length:261 start_codon:yes stop_codon:yes gene_type:complete